MESTVKLPLATVITISVVELENQTDSCQEATDVCGQSAQVVRYTHCDDMSLSVVAPHSWMTVTHTHTQAMGVCM